MGKAVVTDDTFMFAADRIKEVRSDVTIMKGASVSDKPPPDLRLPAYSTDFMVQIIQSLPYTIITTRTLAFWSTQITSPR